MHLRQVVLTVLLITILQVTFAWLVLMVNTVLSETFPVLIVTLLVIPATKLQRTVFNVPKIMKMSMGLVWSVLLDCFHLREILLVQFVTYLVSVVMALQFLV